MEKVAKELIAISEEYGLICDVANFDNQAYLDAITASTQTQPQAPTTMRKNVILIEDGDDMNY
jgi:hypothetical protein